MSLMPDAHTRIFIVTILTIFFLFFCSPVLAESLEESDNIENKLPVIDRTLFIEGDKFTFKETEEGIISVWEGNVSVYTEQISIKTELLELELLPDDSVKSLRATPRVIIELTDDAARAVISGEEFIYDFEKKYGQVTNSTIEMVANPVAFDWPVDTEYKIYIKAGKTILDNSDLHVEQPEILLNSMDEPELKLTGSNLSIVQYNNKRYLRIKKLAIYMYGVRIFYAPWTYRRALTHRNEAGLSYSLPKLGFDEDGLEIDQRLHYAFGDGALRDDFIIFRFDIFTNDRWYPEIGWGHDSDHITYDLLYGYERQKDINYEKVRVFKNPDFTFRIKRIEIMPGFYLNSEVKYGFLEEPKHSVERNRVQFKAVLNSRQIPLGSEKFSLNFGSQWRRGYYSGDEEYEILTGSMGFKYSDRKKMSFDAEYFVRDENGDTPFLHDREEILDEIQLRSRIKLSDRWGTGVNARYDLDQDHFRELAWLFSRNFKSYQLSFGWDFADGSMTMEFGLPGSL